MHRWGGILVIWQAVLWMLRSSSFLELNPHRQHKESELRAVSKQGCLGISVSLWYLWWWKLKSGRIRSVFPHISHRSVWCLAPMWLSMAVCDSNAVWQRLQDTFVRAVLERFSWLDLGWSCVVDTERRIPDIWVLSRSSMALLFSNLSCLSDKVETTAWMSLKVNTSMILGRTGEKQWTGGLIWWAWTWLSSYPVSCINWAVWCTGTPRCCNWRAGMSGPGTRSQPTMH